MRVRVTRRGVAAAVAALVLTGAGLVSAAATGPAQAAPAPAAADPWPPDDSFYVPPSPLPAGKPGDVLRWRPSKPGPSSKTVNAWQVMYLSTDALGKPNAVTGTVLLAKNADPATAPVVALTPGTHGPAFQCAPSKMLSIGAFYEQPALDGLLGAGYAVAMTDYEGYQPEPKTTYMVGQSMGHATLDSVRAAMRLPEAGLSADAKVAVRGYSQGGGAAMWAGQQQPEYAPELKLVGVAGGGVPADLVQVSLSLEGKRGFGFLVYALMGLDAAYPELKLDSYLNDHGRTEFAKMRAGACTADLLLDYSNRKLIEFMAKSPVLEPAWLARIKENKLGATPIKVPVFDYHGTRDDIVSFRQAETLRNDYCKLGVAVTWKTYDSDHITPIYTGNADALQFLADRFADKPAAPNC
ncbi:lipase family protein [Amycolatopsis nigrescens]|uniref:lipase family protein n=1 Tax=Amycolatopsis nigrescens TaxID=381445 RepID=UPI00039B9C3D|nr:lipase family protein [Amycolatopsis nigrescens]